MPGHTKNDIKFTVADAVIYSICAVFMMAFAAMIAFGFFAGADMGSEPRIPAWIAAVLTAGLFLAGIYSVTIVFEALSEICDELAYRKTLK